MGCGPKIFPSAGQKLLSSLVSSQPASQLRTYWFDRATEIPIPMISSSLFELDSVSAV